MTAETDAVILPDSPEAAQWKRVEIEGWFARDGTFYGTHEYAARHAGATHRPCIDCGVPVPKYTLYTRCAACQETHAAAVFNALPEAPWDGSGMIYSDARDQYYNSLDSALDAADLRLLHCEPVMARELDSEYWCDALPDDGDLPPALGAAMSALNAVIRTLPPLSYVPGRVRVRLADGA